MKKIKARQTSLLFILIMSVFLITGCGGDADKTGHWLPPDTTAPTVTLTAPANAAKGVAISSAVNATFSEAMDRLTITTTTFTLKQGATAVLGKCCRGDGPVNDHHDNIYLKARGNGCFRHCDLLWRNCGLYTIK